MNKKDFNNLYKLIVQYEEAMYLAESYEHIADNLKEEITNILGQNSLTSSQKEEIVGFLEYVI